MSAGHYMLFVLERPEVPSEDGIVRVGARRPPACNRDWPLRLRLLGCALLSMPSRLEERDQFVLRSEGTRATEGLTPNALWVAACWGGAYEALKSCEGGNGGGDRQRRYLDCRGISQ